MQAVVSGLMLALLTGCSLQGPFREPVLETPVAWSQPGGNSAASEVRPADWWKALGDPAVDRLAERALQNGPSVAQALARVAAARASLGEGRASRYPVLKASAALTRGQEENSTAANGQLTELYAAATAGPSLSWEVDLFGRVRENVAAAQSRLDARTADAQAARLALVADIADTVLALRACNGLEQLDATERDSYQHTLQLATLRQKAGFSTAAELARLQTAEANARTTLAAQQQTCMQYANALVALTGEDVESIHRLAALPAAPAEDPFGIPDVWLPGVPASGPELPAKVIAAHPAMVAAMKDLQAAWADIGVARAERYPRLDLAAALTDEWISALGTSLHYLTWSVGPSLGVTVFDGGAGSARVAAAQARYEEALARLRGTLRTTVQDVENALAAVAAAQASREAAEDAAVAAQVQLEAGQARVHAGMLSEIDFEDTRRQAFSSRQLAITARRDQARAWVALMKASGATSLPQEAGHE